VPLFEGELTLLEDLLIKFCHSGADADDAPCTFIGPKDGGRMFIRNVGISVHGRLAPKPRTTTSYLDNSRTTNEDVLTAFVCCSMQILTQNTVLHSCRRSLLYGAGSLRR
jgi:hypothetical protein